MSTTGKSQRFWSVESMRLFMTERNAKPGFKPNAAETGGCYKFFGWTECWLLNLLPRVRRCQ
jgi:hypothetical protein